MHWLQLLQEPATPEMLSEREDDYKALICTVLRHLVVALPGAAFAGNRDVAVLVAQLLGDDPLAGPYAVAKVQDFSLCSLPC